MSNDPSSQAYLIKIYFEGVNFIYMFKCMCGRDFDSKQSRAAHYKFCEVYRNYNGLGVAPRPFINKEGINPGYGWNRGLTQDTDERIKRQAEKCKERYKSTAQPYKGVKWEKNNYQNHRKVMESHINRDILPQEVVHHIDGDTQNNNIDNLMLFDSKSSHAKYHACIRYGKEYKLIKKDNGSYICEVLNNK